MQVGIVFVLVWLLNYGISWWNCRAAGRGWDDAKAAGGWARFMCVCGWLMGAFGFTWCYTLLLALGAHELGFLDAYWTVIAVKLGYLLLAPEVVLIGLFITVDSWIQAYRERSLLSVGTAAWNTYAQISNTVDLFSNFGRFFSDVSSAFSGGGSGSDSDDSNSDNSGKAVLLVIGLVVAAFVVGFIQALVITRLAARRARKELEWDMMKARQEQQARERAPVTHGQEHG